MTLGMEQFLEVFFEEAEEHLANLEHLLLTLDLTAPDAEALNGIFRAAHSIKGSSGMFGFDDLTSVTHVLETLLDKIRSGVKRQKNAVSVAVRELEADGKIIRGFGSIRVATPN